MARGTGKITKAPAGKAFMFKPRVWTKKKANFTKLILDEKPCGCIHRFPVLKIKCDTHLARAQAIAETRRKWNSTPNLLWPKKKAKKKVKPVEDSPEVIAAIRAEIERRTALACAEFQKIGKKSSKMTKKEREHLHTFAFTAEQVREEILKS